MKTVQFMIPPISLRHSLKISVDLVHDNLNPYNLSDLVDLQNLTGRKRATELESSILPIDIYLSKSATGQYTLVNLLI